MSEADAKRGWFRRLFGRAPAMTGQLGDGAAESDSAEPTHLVPEDEPWLERLIAEVGHGRRLDEIGAETFWQHIDSIWDRGHERLSTEWLEKFIAAPATPAETAVNLRAALIERLDERGDSLAALPHLELLVRIPAHELRAHYLLAEHFRRRGDEARALRHYEAVLARDVDYPNVRARAERLRARRGLAGASSAAETIAGAEGTATLAGSRYRLLSELGRGASGIVYLARDTEFDREVAVKLLHPHLARARGGEATAMFFHEARITASLRHPNIVAVLDLDEAAGRIVMELAAGGTLREVLRDRGPRKVRRALERHVQILSALDAAHRRGVIHRDLKPANLMFRRDPDEPGAEIMLGDFGVAHLQTDRKDDLQGGADDSRKAAAIGTLAYMSPEQRRGEIEARADVFAAAVVFYEMVTGAVPWSREVVLSGARTLADFDLPDAVRAQISSALADDLQQHLRGLAALALSDRTPTDAALEQALALRDRAIGESIEALAG